MDDLLNKAIARREQLRNELSAIDKFIADYQRIREQEARRSQASDQMTLWSPASTRAAKAAGVAQLVKASERAILAAGKPLTRSELLHALAEEGLEVEGTDKSKVLGTNLWRSKRFLNLKGVGYWPAHVAVPKTFKHLQPRQD